MRQFGSTPPLCASVTYSKVCSEVCLLERAKKDMSTDFKIVEIFFRESNK